MDDDGVQLRPTTVKRRVDKHLLYRTGNEARVTFAQPPKIKYPIKCWWCSHCIESSTDDVQIPRQYGRDGGETVVFGHFHTVGCATSFLYEHYMSSTHERRIFYTWKLWLKDHYDIKMRERPPRAPHFSQLSDFGGTLSRAEFDKIANSGAFIIFLPPNCVSLPMVQEMTLRLTDPKQATVVNTMVTGGKTTDLNEAKRERSNRHRSGPLATHTIARPFKAVQPFRSLGEFMLKGKTAKPATTADASGSPATAAAAAPPAFASAAQAPRPLGAVVAAPIVKVAESPPASKEKAQPVKRGRSGGPATKVADPSMPPPPPRKRRRGRNIALAGAGARQPL